MGRVVQISIIGRVFGNVNADEVIGQRITLKKMYSNTGEVFPFVSARAIKRAIREALKERGYKIDTFIPTERGERALPLADSGRPDELIDNDLFGYMLTAGQKSYSRQGPIAMSYFKALRDTPIKAEFGARFPRVNVSESNPVPFEVEVADFIGRLNVIIYDYIGIFDRDGENPDIKKKVLEKEERMKRLKDFLEILLLPGYVLPKRTNSLNIPEYYGSLILLSEVGPLPVYTYHTYDFEDNIISIETLSKLKILKERYGDKVNFLYIDYLDKLDLSSIGFIKKTDVINAVKEIVEFIIR